MKKIIPLFFLLAFSICGATEVVNASVHNNFISTKKLYAKFLSGPTPDIAGLTLFANVLPKGGDLHHHFSGSIYVENYLELIKENEFCIFKSSDPALKAQKYRVDTNPSLLTNEQRAICLSVDDVLKDNLFYRNLLMEWSSKDYSNHFHDQTPPDKHFFDTFRYFENVSPYGYKSGLQLLKERAKQENVSYIETMLKSSPSIVSPEVASIFKSLKPDSSDSEIRTAIAQTFQILKNHPESKSKIAEYVNLIEGASQNIDDDTFKMRFLAYTSRNSSPEIVFSRLYTSFAAADQSNKIVGVNMVGAENHHIAMKDYTLHMHMIAFLRNQFPNVKISLHAGELVLGMVPPEGLRFHINQAVKLAQANRIGHGVGIAHETNAQELLALMAKKQVVVEVNITSNKDILGVKGPDHPLSIYRSYKVPYVISTDDSGISRNNLSGEFQLYISTFRPSYEELKNTVFNSIRYSFLSDQEKNEELKKLKNKFNAFEAQMATYPKK